MEGVPDLSDDYVPTLSEMLGGVAYAPDGVTTGPGFPLVMDTLKDDFYMESIKRGAGFSQRPDVWSGSSGLERSFYRNPWPRNRMIPRREPEAPRAPGEVRIEKKREQQATIRAERKSAYLKGRRDQGTLQPAPAPEYSTKIIKKAVDYHGSHDKWIDTGHTGAVPTTLTDAASHVSGALGALNCSVQGSTENNRKGSKIQMKSLQINGRVYAPSMVALGYIAPTIYPQYGSFHVHVAVCLDKNPEAKVAPTMALVYSDPTNAGGATGLLRNLENTRRFTVLATELLEIKMMSQHLDTGAQTTYWSSAPFKIHRELHDIDVSYVSGAGAGTSADILQNKIVVFAMATAPASAHNPVPYISYNSRVRFVDK